MGSGWWCTDPASEGRIRLVVDRSSWRGADPTDGVWRKRRISLVKERFHPDKQGRRPSYAQECE
ncbi:hypothetical protein MA16_Dca002960 [Dendrobium catenatum]|uniref:Uncharacterized protein n=1 Tax=Dendrobium catenatum TaxID=906689 RepID=A0A2I0X939_9ASPA|nr:hypothetical protein MA16_Dca002960 [Dendrobium catenatum]